MKLGIRYQVSGIRLLSATFVLFSLLSTGYCLLATNIIAQSPTPEASPAAEEEVLDEKIEGIREAVKEKVQERLEEARKGQRRAFVGEITGINTTMVLDTHQGEKQVTVSEETTIIGMGRKEIEFEDLEIGGFAIAMGYLQDSEILDARRIVIIKKPEFPARLVAFGKVEDKSAEEKILTVKHPKKGTVYMVEVTGTTKITKKIEGERKQIKFDDIAFGDRLVAIGKPAVEENNFLTAKLIHVIPGKAEGQEEATPTPEEITPSPEIEE